MGEAAQDISNPGTPGQMLVYSLERYGPHSDLLMKHFRFLIEDLCRTVRLVHFHIEQILGPLLTERMAGLVSSGRTPHGRRLDTPPRGFLEAYEKAVVFTSDDVQRIEEHVGAKGCIEFLAGVPAHFSSRDDSFARWAFASRPDSRLQLLVPWTLAETATSSVHLALLSKLDPQEKGAYGRSLGSRFEMLVGNLFRRHYPGIRVDQRRRFPGQLGDTDLLVEIDDNAWVLIQCKGRALRPEGRWGRQITYKADFDRNVSEAADQAREALAAIGNERRIVSVFIVLDAYFAGVTAYSHASGAVAKALHGLPKPLVLVYYDLDYLLRHVGRNVLFSFLEWRETLLRTGRFYLTDEFDVVRLYLRRLEFPPGLFERLEFNLNFIGFDRDFQALTLAELDGRLFPDGGRDFRRLAGA